MLAFDRTHQFLPREYNGFHSAIFHIIRYHITAKPGGLASIKSKMPAILPSCLVDTACRVCISAVLDAASLIFSPAKLERDYSVLSNNRARSETNGVGTVAVILLISQGFCNVCTFLPPLSCLSSGLVTTLSNQAMLCDEDTFSGVVQHLICRADQESGPWC